MKKETTLWLLLLLVGLAAVVWWQRGREADDLGVMGMTLFEGVQVERVKALDVDHLERGYQLRLERDKRGAWYITDPVLYPADLGVVTVLLDVVRQSRALIVPRIERDPAALGLEPPRAIFTVEEDVEGETVEHVVELGMLDIDGRRVNARRDGRLLRIPRTLDTTLKRYVNDFRSKRAIQVDPAEVVELNRTGEYQRDTESLPVPLRLSAIRDGIEWRALAPVEGLLDPRDLSVVLYGSATLEIDSFVDEAAVSLADYGLDPPDMRIELRTADGAREALLFGRVGFGGSWHCCREGERFVFGVAREDMARLMLPLEELLDRHVVRVVKDQVSALRLECEDRALRVERGGDGWTVAAVDAAGEPLAPPRPAEPEKVAEILSRLEHAELTEFRLGERFPQDAPRRGVFVELANRRLGGRIGGLADDPEGRELLVYQRLGDEFVSWVEPWLGELACTEAYELRALDLVQLVETDVVGLTLARGGESLEYVRSDRGRWSRAGEEAEATALLPALDPLIFLSAREHLPQSDAPLDDGIEVRFARRDGSTVAFTVGLLEGESVIELGEARSLAKVADLHARLAALFGG